MFTPYLHGIGKAIFAAILFFIVASIPMMIGNRTAKTLGMKTPILLAVLIGIATFLLSLP